MYLYKIRMRARNIEVLRDMHAGFFDMFEMREQNTTRDNSDDNER